jgi:hypothetical protein
VKLFIVSDHDTLIKNTGFIQGSFDNYDAAFEAASVGQYIHQVEIERRIAVINGGKMASVISGRSE